MRAPVRRRILTVAERNHLRAKLSAGPLGYEPADVGNGGQWYQAPHDHHLDPVEVAEKRRRVQAIIDAGSPQDESRSYKAKRDRRIRELEETLRKDSVPLEHFHMKRADSTGYHKTVKELARQMTDPRRQALEGELKNLRREREPEDPSAGKIEDLREERRITA